jgi:hypothetical protein
MYAEIWSRPVPVPVAVLDCAKVRGKHIAQRVEAITPRIKELGLAMSVLIELRVVG